MTDLVSGMIIGGVIGVVGSAVLALIQGWYSLKSTREQNSARERQQSMQIKHERDSHLMAMQIARRSSYLEPLSTYLSQLFNSLDDYQSKLIQIITPYWCDSESRKIRVPEANRQTFAQQLSSTNEEFQALVDKRRKVFGGTLSHISDIKLIRDLTGLSDAILTLYSAGIEMYTGLNTNTPHDFVYDFEPFVESLAHVQLNITIAQRHIDYLLAGADIDGS